jgi:hypothetical protein
MRLTLCFALLVTGLACDSPTEAPLLDQYAGTLSVTLVDTNRVPFAFEVTPPCQYINNGGWLSMDGKGRFAMSIDNITTVCDGIVGGGVNFLATKGKYSGSGRNLSFSPDSGQGSPFTGVFFQGTPITSNGGLLTAVYLTYGVHTYELVGNVATER